MSEDPRVDYELADNLFERNAKLSELKFLIT